MLKADDTATPHSWMIERKRSAGVSAGEFWRAWETPASGTMDWFETPRGVFARAGLEVQPKRWLAICLDGVPLGVMQSLWDRGHFREFLRPTAVVSVLPSDSEVALTALLHTDPPPGYEHLYFDREHNEVRGGWWVTLSGHNIPYIRALDYDPPGWAKALPYILLRKTYSADLGRFRKRFLKSHSGVFLAHISSSDSVMHMMTTAEAEPLLIEFENLVRELYLDARGELGVLLFSDHGNNQSTSRAIALKRFLGQHGWHCTKGLDGPRDVVVPMYGLIGFCAVYCQRESADALAQDLAQLEGVQLIVVREENGRAATIVSANRRARLSWIADGSRYLYEPQQGDPLLLCACLL